MFWTIQSFPTCKHHVFLSHSAEDRAALVTPVFESLRNAGISPWLDRHDYPYGRGSRAALRDAILSCRHVVFFVSDAMLVQARGWCVQELAWAELLQDNLVREGGPAVLNVVLPLFFVNPADARLPRSVWNAVREKGPFCPDHCDRVVWAVEQISSFLRREQSFAAELKRFARRTADFRQQLQARLGLKERVTHFDPSPLL